MNIKQELQYVMKLYQKTTKSIKAFNILVWNIDGFKHVHIQGEEFTKEHLNQLNIEYSEIVRTQQVEGVILFKDDSYLIRKQDAHDYEYWEYSLPVTVRSVKNYFN